MFAYHCRSVGEHSWLYNATSEHIYCAVCGAISESLSQVAKDGGYTLRDKMADRLIASGLDEEAAVKAANAVRLTL